MSYYEYCYKCFINSLRSVFTSIRRLVCKHKYEYLGEYEGMHICICYKCGRIATKDASEGGDWHEE